MADTTIDVTHIDDLLLFATLIAKRTIGEDDRDLREDWNWRCRGHCEVPEAVEHPTVNCCFKKMTQLPVC